jgi:hypothetical protein
VVTGSRSVVPSQERLPCGVVATSSAQWMWIADTLGFDPEWCYLGKSVQDSAWLTAAYPRTAFLREPSWARPVSVVFCDGRPPPFVYQIDGLMLLFHCKAARSYHQASWTTHSVRFRHSTLGGLTLLEQRLLCTTSAGRAYAPSKPPTGLPSCVYTVVSDTIAVGCKAKAPTSRRMGQSEVSPLSGSLFHGGGLYPVGKDAPRARPVFLLPSVLQPTGWCKRRLTMEEEWMIYDVPHRITSLLRSREIPRIHQDFKQLVQGWCLESGVRHFMTSFGIKNEGGRLLFPRREREKSSEGVARLIVSAEAPVLRLAELRIGKNVGASKPSAPSDGDQARRPPTQDSQRESKRQRREPSLKAAASGLKIMPSIPEEVETPPKLEESCV